MFVDERPSPEGVMSNPLEISISTVDPTSPGEVEAAVAAALAGISEAADLDELKLVRLAHTGDKSTLALANRALYALMTSRPHATSILVARIRLLATSHRLPRPHNSSSLFRPPGGLIDQSWAPLGRRTPSA